MKKVLLLLGLGVTSGAWAIINGSVIEPGRHPEIIQLPFGNERCSGVIVGPRTVMTTASCLFGKETTLAIQVGGRLFQVHFQTSPFYPNAQNDLALGLADDDLGVTPASVQLRAHCGQTVSLAGFGCEVDGAPSSGAHRPLRIGETVVMDLTDAELVTDQPGMAAACYGDSGGPVLSKAGEVLGVIAAGNNESRTYSTRLDSKQSAQFLQSFIESRGAEICGLNRDCSSIRR